MLGPLNHHHYHHHHQHHQHHHKVFSSWQRAPQPSHRSLPNMKKHSKKYLALLQQRGNSACEGASRAYFSRQPPLEPMKLVLVGDFTSQAFESHKIQQLVKNCEAINFYKDAEYGIAPVRVAPSSTFRLSSKETVTTEKSLAPTSSAIYSLNDATRFSHRESRKDKKDVRQLLHQLIANLPVSTSAAASETSILRSRSQSPVQTHRSSCSIAVQARMISSSEDKLSTLNTVEGEEWMGGVRALRDSHVRLVQRQLRHIERLNRALDRVTKNFSKNTNKHVHF